MTGMFQIALKYDTTDMMQIGISSLWGKEMKRSTWGLGGQIKVTEGRTEVRF